MTTSSTYWLAVWIVAALALLAHDAKADTAVHLGAYSYHVATGYKTDYNSNHELTAIEHDGWLAGRFKNSYSRETQIAAKLYSRQWGNWRGTVGIGLSRGYRSCFGDDGDRAVVCPIAFPSLHYTRWRVQPGIVVFGEAVAISARVIL